MGLLLRSRMGLLLGSRARHGWGCFLGLGRGMDGAASWVPGEAWMGLLLRSRMGLLLGSWARHGWGCFLGPGRGMDGAAS